MATNSTDDDVVESYCKSVLYKEIDLVGIRYWDVAILVPNLLFLAFLCILFRRARMKLYATNSPVFLCFYGLIWICAIFSVLRCVISMGLSSLHVDEAVQNVTNKILWTLVRFALLTGEVSVLIFSLAFGQLESSHSIKAVLTTTGIISLVFSIVQGALELVLPSELGVFAHGGVIFLLTTSVIFTLLYTSVYLLPYTRLSNVIVFPVRPSFYRYTLTLLCSCLVITVGCAIVLSPWSHAQCGYCLINLSHYLYFSFFVPLVYLIFLNDYCYHPAKIPFSYTMNESIYEDNVNSIESFNTYVDDDNNSFMHHQGSINNCEVGESGDAVMAGSSSGMGGHQSHRVSANQFDLNGPVYGHNKGVLRSQDQINYHRFLYNTNIQSPGTGYSSVEESTTATASAHGSMEFIQQQQQQQQQSQVEDSEDMGKANNK